MDKERTEMVREDLRALVMERAHAGMVAIDSALDKPGLVEVLTTYVTGLVDTTQDAHRSHLWDRTTMVLAGLEVALLEQRWDVVGDVHDRLVALATCDEASERQLGHQTEPITSRGYTLPDRVVLTFCQHGLIEAITAPGGLPLGRGARCSACRRSVDHEEHKLVFVDSRYLDEAARRLLHLEDRYDKVIARLRSTAEVGCYGTVFGKKNCRPSDLCSACRAQKLLKSLGEET